MDRLMEQVSAEDWLDSLSIFWDYGYTINDVYDMPVMKCAFENEPCECLFQREILQDMNT